MPSKPSSPRPRAAAPKRAKRRAPSKPAPWGARPQSRAAQREIKEDVLYETAARWFNAHGFHGTSLADLATELGITKAAFYHYVRDKRELLYRLHLRALDVAEAAHRGAVAAGVDGLDRVRRIAVAYVTAVTASDTATLLLLEHGVLSPKQAGEVLARRRWLEHDLRAQIASGVADGTIAPCDPKLASFSVVGMLHWVTKWYDPAGPWTGPQVADATGRMVARMLAAGSPPPLPTDVAALPAPAKAVLRRPAGRRVM